MANYVEGITSEDIENAKVEIQTSLTYAKNDLARVKGNYWAKISTFQVKWEGRLWRVTESYDLGAGNHEPCELCGFPNCRYKFVIKSPRQIANEVILESDTTEERLSIGDCCVINYADIKGDDAKNVKKVKETMIRQAKVEKDTSILYELVALKQKLKERQASPLHDHNVKYLVLKFINRILKGYGLSKKELDFIKNYLGKILVSSEVEITTNIQETINKARHTIEWKDFRYALVGSYFPLGTKVAQIIVDFAENVVKESLIMPNSYPMTMETQTTLGVN